VAFGWFGTQRAFALAERQGDGQWHVLQRYGKARPPLTNWVRLGIGVRRGCLVEARLDGQLVLQQELTERVAGPFHLVASGGTTEWDDVRVRSYPLPDPAWTPICVRSANFSTKQRKNRSDPRQFGEWSRGQDAFRIGVARDAKLGLLRRITTSRPLLGDWRYESVPYSGRLGEFPDGRYRFEILPEKRDLPGTPQDEVVAVVDATRSPEGWAVVDPKGGPALAVAGAVIPTGRNRRLADRSSPRRALAPALGAHSGAGVCPHEPRVPAGGANRGLPTSRAPRHLLPPFGLGSLRIRACRLVVDRGPMPHGRAVGVPEPVELPGL
jgi:hypothetical protein